MEDKFTIFRREVHRFLKDTSGRRLEDLLDRLKERFDIKEDDLPTIQQAIEIGLKESGFVSATHSVVEDKLTIFRREVRRFLKEDTSGRNLEDFLDRLEERFGIEEDDLPTIQQAIEIEMEMIGLAFSAALQFDEWCDIMFPQPHPA